MAGFIQCNYGGGGGPVERIEGTMTGSASGTVTVTSQQGKTPKRAQFWNTSHTGAETFTGGVYWNDQYSAASFPYCYFTNAMHPTQQAINTSATIYYAKVSAVGANSITLLCPSTANYAKGTWKYIVEFE